ncbi:MAG: hypothetical protein IT372_42200 [Polyangiaceae bacterium]|nr:hypothetical protein [Polyangiaceae bacterium]
MIDALPPLDEALDEALAEVERLPAHPARATAAAALRAAIDRPDDPAAALAAVRRAAAQVLAAAGPAAAAPLHALAVALSAALAAAEEDGEDPFDLEPPPAAPPLPTASRGPPRARPIPAAHFTASLDEGGDEEDPFADDGEDDEDPEPDEPAPAVDEAAVEAEFAALDREAEVALAGGPDDPLAAFDAAEPPPVRLGDEGGEPVPVTAFHAEIVEACAEVMSSLARDRALRPALERPALEDRILEQLDAVLVTGPGCLNALFRAFGRALESPEPYRIWGPTFALACVDGGESLRALAAALTSLPEGARALGRVAAEALAASPHPGLDRLATALIASPHPIARAAGLDLRARGGALPLEAILPHLDDPSPAVMEAALRALARLPAPGAPAPPSAQLPDLVGALRLRMRSPDPEVAWQAARLLLLWGHDDPLIAVREARPEAATLGARAMEILVLGGEAADLARMEPWIRRTPVTPALLSAIARFGHPGAWSFLAHHLADEDLADPAAAALETLFGARVPAPERKLPRAWRAAIAALRLDPAVRYRRGEPWRPEVVCAEWEAGALPRAEIAVRADELIARARAAQPSAPSAPNPVNARGSGSPSAPSAPNPPDLDGWTPDPEAALTALGAAACAARASSPAGAWQ